MTKSPSPILSALKAATANEQFEFRWNTRKDNDAARVSKAIRMVQGKRLEYRESVDNPPYVVG